MFAEACFGFPDKKLRRFLGESDGFRRNKKIMWTLLQQPRRATHYGRRCAADNGSVLSVSIIETGSH